MWEGRAVSEDGKHVGQRTDKTGCELGVLHLFTQQARQIEYCERATGVPQPDFLLACAETDF